VGCDVIETQSARSAAKETRYPDVARGIEAARALRDAKQLIVPDERISR